MSSLETNYIDLANINNNSEYFNTQELFWNVVVSRKLRFCNQIRIKFELTESNLLIIIQNILDNFRREYCKSFIQFLGCVYIGFDDATSKYIYNIYVLIIPTNAIIQLKKYGIKNIKIFITLNENEKEISVLSDRPLDETIAMTDIEGNNAPYESSIIYLQ